jgi:hypothetical protein
MQLGLKFRLERADLIQNMLYPLVHTNSVAVKRLRLRGQQPDAAYKHCDSRPHAAQLVLLPERAASMALSRSARALATA